jgi:hypothetical protein
VKRRGACDPDGMRLKPRTGDAARVMILLGAVALAVGGSVREGLALALVAPPALALRLLPAGRALDGALCAALLCAQLGAVAGLTETTVWWDGTAHAVTGALVAVLLVRLLPSGSLAGALTGVVLLAAGWEVLERLIDATAGTNFSPSTADTIGDLLLGAAGAVGAMIYLAARRSTVHAARGGQAEVARGCGDRIPVRQLEPSTSAHPKSGHGTQAIELLDPSS